MNTSINIVMDRACTIYHHAKFELQMKLVQRERKKRNQLMHDMVCNCLQADVSHVFTHTQVLCTTLYPREIWILWTPNVALCSFAIYNVDFAKIGPKTCDTYFPCHFLYFLSFLVFLLVFGPRKDSFALLFIQSHFGICMYELGS